MHRNKSNLPSLRLQLPASIFWNQDDTHLCHAERSEASLRIRRDPSPECLGSGGHLYLQGSYTNIGWHRFWIFLLTICFLHYSQRDRMFIETTLRLQTDDSCRVKPSENILFMISGKNKLRCFLTCFFDTINRNLIFSKNLSSQNATSWLLTLFIFITARCKKFNKVK